MTGIGFARITRTSQTPLDPLQIVLNGEIGRSRLVMPTAATEAGPTWSEEFEAEIGLVFEDDPGLKPHFTVEYFNADGSPGSRPEIAPADVAGDVDAEGAPKRRARRG